MIQNVRKAIVGISLFISILSMFAMMITTCSEIVLRLCFRKSILGLYEYNEAFLMYVTLIGLVYAYSAGKGVIRVELFIDRFSEAARRISNMIVLLFSLAVFALLSYSATLATYQDFIIGEHRHGIVQFPLWPLKLSETLCGILMVVFIAEGIIKSIVRHPKQ